MNNDKGKLYYGVGLDNAQLRADAAESKNIIRGIGDSAASEGNRIDSTFRKIGGTIAAVFTVQQAAAFAKSIVQVRGEIESLEISFQTLLGNKQKADALFSEIRTFASNTPMQLNDLAKGAQMLLSFNMEAERVMPTLKQIGDISMGDAQKFNSLTLAFSQMSSTGKLMGQDLLQMINSGFNPLTVMAEKSGKSVAQLKNDMAAGAITSEMVADAFAAATAEGGKFYGMLEKQSKGINGSISNLKGAIDDMFNDLGTSNQEFITESIQGATNIVKHYDEIGKIIAELIVAYGLYKSAVISVEAVQQSIATVKHTEEAASLYQLLPAEQQAKISKQGLSKSSAEYYALVKSETAANVQASQTTLAKARVEVKAASETVAARRAEYIAAKQLEEQRIAELMSIGATGSAKQVEAAQRKLSAAETQRESAAIAFQSATRDFNTKKTVVETAARTANTTSAAVNTAAETANATATGFLTVAKNRLAAAAARANAVIMANPYAIAAAAAIALGYGLYKLITYQTDAEKAQKKLNDAINESDKSIAAEVHQLDSMFGRLKAAKQGTDEYRAAKEAIMNRYGGYLKKLGDEKTALNDIAAAYALIKDEAIKAARARAMETYTGEAAKDRADAEEKSLGKVEKLLDKKYKGKKGEDGISLSETYYWKIKPVIEGESEITPEIEKILKEFDKTKYFLGDPVTDSEESSYVVNALRDEINAAAIARSIFDKSMNEARLKFGENPTTDDSGKKNTFDATTASLQQLMDRLPKAKEELAALKKAEQPDASAIAAKEKEIQQIKDQTAAREKSLSAIKDVKAQIKLLQDEQEKYGKDDAEYKALETRIKSLKTKLPATEGQGSKGENDEARIKRETAERNQKIQEYSESVAKQVKQSELDIAQARIDAMDEGFNKEMAQNEQAYNRLIFANQQREAEMLEALRDARELEWENKNPKAKAKGETFDRSTVTVADLSSEQKSSISEYYKMAEEIRKKANKDSLEKILSDVMTYEQQRTKIAEDYAKQREQLYNHDQDGNRSGFKQGIEQGNVDELDRNEQEALNAVDLEFASREASFNTWINGLVGLGLSQLKEALLTARQTLDSGGGYLSDKEKAALRAKIAALEKQIDVENTKSPEQRAAEKSKKQWGDTIKVMNGVQETVGNIINSFDGLDEATKQALSAATNIAGGIIGMISGIQALAVTGAEAIKGVERASVILAIIGTAVQIITTIFNLAGDAEKRHQEALAEVARNKLAMQREYNQLLFEQNLLLKEATSVFGVDEITKAINAFEQYRDQLSKYKAELKGSMPVMNFFDLMTRDTLSSYNKRLNDYKNGIGALNEITIKTGHEKTGLFGWGKGRDIYTPILDVYDDIIDKEGNLNIERAKAILATQELSEEDRARLQNIIDLQENADKAKEELNSYLESTFGVLGGDILDAITDGIKNGTDAWKEFGKTGASVLEKLGKQIAYELFFSEKFKKLQAQLTELYSSGKSPEEIAKEAQKLIADFYSGIGQDMKDADEWLKNWKAEAKEQGLDLWSVEREASNKGFASMSQDSADELNGRFTVIQGHTYDIREAVKAIALNKSEIDISSNESNIEYLPNISANVLDIQESTKILADNSKNTLELLLGIESNTGRLHSMGDDIADVRMGVTEMRQTVNDIALKGIKLK